MTLGTPIQINGGTDALTGKKKKYTLTSDFLTNTLTFLIQLYETDGVTPAVPGGNTLRQKQAVSTIEMRFDINQTLIDTTTKLFTTMATGAVSILGSAVGGTGYTAGTKATTGGTGTGLTVGITVTGGVPDPAVTIVTPGSGYTAGDVVTIAGGTATVTIGGVGQSIPVGSVYLSDYFQQRAINAYQGVANGDSSINLVKGWFKDFTSILELNSQI